MSNTENSPIPNKRQRKFVSLSENRRKKIEIFLNDKVGLKKARKSCNRETITRNLDFDMPNWNTDL